MSKRKIENQLPVIISGVISILNVEKVEFLKGNEKMKSYRVIPSQSSLYLQAHSPLNPLSATLI